MPTKKKQIEEIQFCPRCKKEKYFLEFLCGMQICKICHKEQVELLHEIKIKELQSDIESLQDDTEELTKKELAQKLKRRQYYLDNRERILKYHKKRRDKKRKGK